MGVGSSEEVNEPPAFGNLPSPSRGTAPPETTWAPLWTFTTDPLGQNHGDVPRGDDVFFVQSTPREVEDSELSW